MYIIYDFLSKVWSCLCFNNYDVVIIYDYVGIWIIFCSECIKIFFNLSERGFFFGYIVLVSECFCYVILFCIFYFIWNDFCFRWNES